ncbi:MAG: hypothetical protein JAY67_11335, partial [Candidatus Thiodiazotropha taylori]|nr:hypothetical protein [Candidatus Thiodiazotropha taylori]
MWTNQLVSYDAIQLKESSTELTAALVSTLVRHPRDCTESDVASFLEHLALQRKVTHSLTLFALIRVHSRTDHS